MMMMAMRLEAVAVLRRQPIRQLVAERPER